jgi:hypothetical protein
VRTALGLVAAASVALGACVATAPMSFSEDSPTNPKAPSGFVSSPTAIEEYKSAEDLTSRAEEDAQAPAMDHSAHRTASTPQRAAPAAPAAAPHRRH